MKVNKIIPQGQLSLTSNRGKKGEEKKKRVRDTPACDINKNDLIGSMGTMKL